MPLVSSLNEFHFLRPEWFFALVPVLVVHLFLVRRDAAASNWSRAIDPTLLPHLLSQGVGVISLLPFWLLLLGWLATITSLAGPVWEKTPQPVHEKEDALIILLDLSLSMYATDLKPNRITRARQKLIDILQSRNEGVTGLIVYAADAHAVTPLTDDAATIEAMIPALEPSIMPVFGSKLSRAVELASQMLRDGNVTQGRMLILTDEIADSASAIAAMRSLPEFEFSVLGLGTTEGGPILLPGGESLKDSSGTIVIPRAQFDRMNDITAAVNGRFAVMDVTGKDFSFLLAGSAPIDNEDYRQIERDFDVWLEQGAWLVLLILPLALLAFRRGWIWGLVLLIAIQDQPVLADAQPQPESSFWADLWQTPDQQGAAALAEGDAARAAEIFEDPDWKASALYRSNQFERAADIFQTGGDVENQYNLGNALARAHKLNEALEAYNEVLKRNPEHEDALFNRDLVKQLLEQEQQQNQDEPKDNEEQDQQEQDQQQDNQQGSSGQDDQSEEAQDSKDQASQDESQDEQQPEPAEQQTKEPQNPAEPEEQEVQPADAEPLDEEARQSQEQWLRRIPDDPGGLLRRKFEAQANQRRREGKRNYEDRDAVW